MTDFSRTVLAHRDARSPQALQRIAIAKRRVQSILDRYTVAHQKTLEQKIAEQGPNKMRVDPHLIGLAIKDLLELNRLAVHVHQATGQKPWYANPGTSPTAVTRRLDVLAPLYASVSEGNFHNLSGDALEVVVFKCLHQVFSGNRRFAYQGQFHSRPTEGKWPL